MAEKVWNSAVKSLHNCMKIVQKDEETIEQNLCIYIFIYLNYMLAMHLLRKISKKKNLKTQALLIVFFFRK